MTETLSRLFVAMPYGEREGLLDHEDPRSGCKIHFDEVWKDLIEHAIPETFTARRADDLREPGLIDQLYNEWLLDADVVLADLTFANPNVFYELGIRQALSRKGTVLIAQARTRLPFDVRNQFVLNYDYFKAPSIHKFQRDLRQAILNAAASERGSPIHTFLPGLFVGRFNPGDGPDTVIAGLRRRVSELEAAAAHAATRDGAERLRRKLVGVTDAARLVRVYHEILVSPGPPLDLLEEAAVALRKAGLIEHAINLLNIARQAWSPDAGVLRELGFCYRKRGPDGHQQARELFEQALHINEADPELHGMLGGMLKRIGKYDEALRHYQRAYELLPNNLYALVNLGLIETIRSDPGNASRYYTEVIRLTDGPPHAGDYWHLLCRGEGAVFLGQPELAFSAYRAAINMTPPVEDVRSAAEQLRFFVGRGVQSDAASHCLKLLEPYITRTTPDQALQLSAATGAPAPSVTR
jgi:tetratricopeptide (TPR) repeat protein